MHPKVLVVVASFGTKNDHYLLQLVQEYQSMSFEVDIIVLSNRHKEVAPGVVVIEVDLRGKNPWTLPFPHKKIFAENLNDYDVFIYSEDDTLLTEKSLRAFLEVSSELPKNEIPGFLRFEKASGGQANFPDMHSHFHWDAGSVLSRGGCTMAFFTNEHAACYALTRQQLCRAIDSGGFLVEPHEGKYDLLCTAATDPYTQCGFRKLICISHLDDFLVHHLPNKYVGTRFGVQEDEFRRQVNRLLQLGKEGEKPYALFPTETRLSGAAHSKDYYEPARPEITDAVPDGARTVLSLGCGWGAIEAELAVRGFIVAAVPLDPLIAGAAEAAGVELIDGGFPESVRKLAGRRFDCLLISNVLHLVPDPAELLSSFSQLLSAGGTAVAVVPNIKRMKGFRKERDARDGCECYERSGVHPASHQAVRNWFLEAGMRVTTFTNVLRPRARRIDRLTFGLMKRWLAYEFVAIATKG
jgi:2-polyprenyl-3-methyl-5-hydroxy-6-metoxy-1,4-benzoquinol methylase